MNPAHEHQFLAELGDVKLGEDVQSLLFYLWVDLRLEDENLLNRDTLALLISEQVSREPAVVSTPKVIATSSAAF